MALRKRLSEKRASSVPVELIAADETLWQDVASSLEWFKVHGLTPCMSFASGPASRRKEAIWGWLVNNGYGSEKWPAIPDWHRLAETGIEGDWQRASTRERHTRSMPER